MRGPATNALHADKHLKTGTDVAPAISLSNIFEYPRNYDEQDEFVKTDHTYSRCTQPNVSRCEAVLSSLLDGHAVAYASGVAAYHAVLTGVAPKRVFIDHAYFGIQALTQTYAKKGWIKVHSLEEIESHMQPGDLVHIETPMSPWGTVLDVRSFVKRAHDKGGIVCFDATIGPPPLIEPFKLGVDIIIHSGSKYLGGHSDVICGVVVTQDEKFKHQLVEERIDLGSILPTFQAWLLLRSLRTFSLRIKQQLANSKRIVQFLVDNQAKFPKLAKIYHTSLQKDAFVSEVLPHGGPMTFSIEMADEALARELPNKLNLFVHATSMGGVESSIEWRALSDNMISRKLLRISIGVEDVEDLIADLANALQ